ncbi:PREDICTED: tRNA dimethylallyltransferase, mitochondrial-like [Wasmannia auropunctata]|uniref:tRNA dimethylallyltransferase, mitochondrial-like n=1 Tax=Wasmannia auropunctata TaxID=64793 RepID=UPI0005EE4ACD|nr:PREDICTED: tRNA dimethylallyltransferase, mitochondrial-like [Wasmannia auropunctata]
MCLAGGTRALLLLALVLCQRAGGVDGKNDNYQMSDVCKKYFLRDLYRKIDGAVLTSQNERELDCAITFQTHSILQRFMLRFDQLQLDCNDHLYIYDGAHAVGSYKKVLDNRLNDRVDGMMEAGLVQELLDFHRRYNEQRIKSNTSPDYTKGIFQTIGFKEFHTYLILPDEERASEKGKKLLQQGIDDLKRVTRRYAKRQDKWVMNRLIRRGDRQVPPVYSLDCTDVTNWDSRVLEPAAAIVSAILHGAKPELRPLNENFENQKTTDRSTNTYHYCQVCERVFVEEHQWQAHLKGAKHMKVLKKKKRTTEDTQSQEYQLASS